MSNETGMLQKLFCNKCGFVGTPGACGLHLRPKDGVKCNYLAPVLRDDR